MEAHSFQAMNLVDIQIEQIQINITDKNIKKEFIII